MEPDRHSILGALAGLLLAETGGDIVDEVFIICDCLGIERPIEDEETQSYRFRWDEE